MGDDADRQLGRARQTVRSIWGQDIRETSTILSDNPIGAWGTGNGNGWGESERGRRGRSETSAEEDRETWRNAATAPSLKTPDPPSLLLFPLVSTTSRRIPLADWHVGCISTRRRGASGCSLPDWWSAAPWSDQTFWGTLWNKTTLGTTAQIAGWIYGALM